MPKSQLDWLNLPHSPTLPLPVTALHRVVEPKQGIDEYGQKDGYGVTTNNHLTTCLLVC